MITQASIQKVIQRADIVEIIGQFMKLKKRGINYIGNCPFHNEKTPSFNVSPNKGIFKCFGCGKGGDVVSFVEEYEKLSFTETVQWLANYYQIELEETAVSEEVKETQRIEESLRIINEYAANYFQNTLLNDNEGQLIGLSYFKERGFTDETISKFKLGYSLNQWEGFAGRAIKDGYHPDLLQKAGLIKKKDNGQYYDSYRGRVIFPIFSPVGKVLGFGARILKKNDKAPKYVNTPENELYVKNKVLYGLYQSRQSISQLNECLLVEGYTDVISLHQAGVTNVVASSGTSLTEGQLKLIRNLTRNLTIIYDGDAAGIKAALRGLDMALADRFNVKLVLLPDGEDPDSFVQRLGADRFKEFLEANKQDVIKFRLEIGLKDVGDDPIKKSQLVNEIAETISKINKIEDFALQEHYIRLASSMLKVEEDGLINLVNKYIHDANKQAIRQAERKEQNQHLPPSGAIGYEDLPPDFEEQMYLGVPTAIPNGGMPSQQSKALPVSTHPLEWHMIRLLIEYGNEPFSETETVAQTIFNTIDLSLLKDPTCIQLYEDMLHYFDQHQVMAPASRYVNHQSNEIKSKIADVLNDEHVPSNGWTDVVKIEVPFGKDVYIEDVNSLLMYFELKMVRKLISDNLAIMQHEKDMDKQMRCMKVHQQLKLKEKELELFVIIK